MELWFYHVLSKSSDEYDESIIEVLSAITAGQEPLIGKSLGFNLQIFPSTKSVNREHRQPLIKSWLEFSRIYRVLR
jgi:hypothetical protein